MALEGTSREQQLFIEEHVRAIAAEGGRPVLVLDGAPYPPKADEVASRRTARDAAERAAREHELAGDGKAAAAAWKRAARPQEPFWAWLLQWCVAKRVAFVVAPNEADEMLVALQEALGDETVIVLAASQDSDLVAYGCTDVIYDWHPVRRTFRRVRLLQDVLGAQVGARSFVGWNYDRFLLFALASGADYFSGKNLPGMALPTVYKLMAGARLDPSLIAPSPHPPLAERPAAWFSPVALLAYVQPVLSRVSPADQESVASRLLSAYYAVRQHPVLRLASALADPLEWAGLAVGAPEPLSSRELDASLRWPTDVVPGLTLLPDAATATRWARGLLRLEGGALVERALPLPAGGATDDAASVDEDDSDADSVAGEPAVALQADGVTLEGVPTEDVARLRSFLGACGFDLPKSTPARKIRQLATQMLSGPRNPVIAPAHPLLAGCSRPARLKLASPPTTIRGEALYQIVQQLKQAGMELTIDFFVIF